jgi:gamma-glutamyl phosphate reductase
MTNRERARAIVDRTVDDLASMTVDRAADFLEATLDAAYAAGVVEGMERAVELMLSFGSEHYQRLTPRDKLLTGRHLEGAANAILQAASAGDEDAALKGGAGL